MNDNNTLNKDKNSLKKEKEEIVEIVIKQIENFPNHPFKVKEETLEELKESISESGITTPLIVRKIEDNKYELVSGHRRKRACEMLGIEKLPCIVRNISREEAIIQMVDSNIQREEVLPSERAFAYKMRLEAIKHQGKKIDDTSHQVGGKPKENESAYSVGQDIGESATQIRRYIRLTELIPELLDMVDEKKIAFNPAVEISYLTKNEQSFLLDAIQCFEATPSLSQAQELKKLSQQHLLNDEVIDNILGVEKPNQIPKYQISYDKFEKYIPRELATPKEVENYLLKCAIVCKERGIEVERMNLDIPKPKNKDRGAR